MKILRRLNRDYLDEKEYFQLNDAEDAQNVEREDYFDEDLDVIPMSDPTAISDMQKLAKAGEAAESTARKAAEFYQYCLDQGLITPDGLGNGHLKQAG